jgi:hypothetical protein
MKPAVLRFKSLALSCVDDRPHSCSFSAQAPALEPSAKAVDSWPLSPAPVGEGVDDVPRADQPGRSAALFSEPRVKTGVLIGRMGMGLLFGGTTAGAGAAMMVVFAYAGATAAVLVPGIILTMALTGLGTALGTAMFGDHYGRDFLDALVVSMVTAGAAAVMFLVGYLVPVLMVPMLITAGVLIGRESGPCAVQEPQLADSH